MLRAIRDILHGPLPEHLSAVRDATMWRKVPFTLLLGGLLGFGIFPKTLTDKIKPSAEAIIGMSTRRAEIAPNPPLKQAIAKALVPQPAVPAKP
jgi:NADH:ubiquinone oxidoreductase subunit 4 (subunit M)